MSVLRYFAHIFNLLSKRKKIFVLLIGSSICFLMLFKDIQDVFVQPNISFNQSLYYCNKPHIVSGSENVGNNLDGYELQQIQILIRHGDRAPIDLKALPNIAPVLISCMFNKTENAFVGELNRYREIIRNNPFYLHGNRYDRLLDERLFCRGGQLTPYGFLQHLYLGNYLQRSYKDFFENIDVKKDIWIQSTNVQRTIQSAAALMTGIFYDHLKELSPENKLGINIFQDRIPDGHFLLDYNFKDLECKPLKVATKRFKLNRTKSLHYKDYSYLTHGFSEILSVGRRHIPPVNRIADILYTKLCHGQGIPYGPHARIPSHLVERTFRNADVYFSERSSFAPEFQTLSLLSQIALRWLQHSTEKNDNIKKFVVYSGHDSMISPFLVLLGVNDGKWPPYASRIIFEFYQKKSDADDTDNDDVYFRVLFNGEIMKGLKFCKSTQDRNDFCHINDLYRYISNDRFNGDKSVEFHPSVLFERIRRLCLNSE